MEPKRPTLRHIIITMAKFKDKKTVLKATREGDVDPGQQDPVLWQQ